MPLMREGTRGIWNSSETPGISLRLLTVSNICTPATGIMKSRTPAQKATQETAARSFFSQSLSLLPPQTNPFIRRLSCMR